MSGKIVAGVIQHPDSPDPNLTLNDDGTVDLFGGEGLGDVVGPASATDNALVRFDGTGGKTVQNSGITVDDSNNVSGVGTFASGAITSSAAVQAAAASGFVSGASGPKIGLSGTGSPEGVVSAPINSVWNRSDGDTLGDFVYHKRSGTGNTGWVVSEGDTGWRDVSASLINGWTTNVVYLRRLGSLVYLSVYSLVGTSASANQFYALPSGFRPYMSQYHPTTRNTVAAQGGYVTAAGVAGMDSSYAYTFHAQWIWPTNNTWPTSLPGSAA